MKAISSLAIVILSLFNTSCSDGGVPVENPMDTVEELSDAQMAELKLHILPIPDIGFEVEKTGNYFIRIGVGNEDFKKYWKNQPYAIKGKIIVSRTDGLEKKILAVFDIEKDKNEVQLRSFAEKTKESTSNDLSLINNSIKITKNFIFNAEQKDNYLIETQFLVPQEVPTDIKTFVMVDRQNYIK